MERSAVVENTFGVPKRVPMNKWLIALLMTFLGLSNSNAKPAWENDPIESVVGIHLLTEYGS